MKKLFIVVIGAMLILGVVALGCGDEAGDTASAAEMIDKAQAKMNETDSFRAAFDMNMEIDGDISDMGAELQDLMPMTLGLNGTADLDMSDSEDPKADIEMELDIEELINSLMESSLGQDMGTDDAMGMSMVSSMLSDIKMRIVDQTLYMQIMGSWYEAPMDGSVVEDVAGGTSPLDLGEVDVADSQCYQDEVTLSKMLKDIEDKGSEDVGDTKTTHITATLDPNAMVDALVEANDKCGGQEMSDSDIAETRDILEGMLTKANVEFWIDEDDNMRKMSIDMEMDMAAASEAAGSLMDQDTAGSLESLILKMTMTIEMSNFGEEIDVEAPSGAMPIEDLFGSFGGLGGSSGDSMDDFGMDDQDMQDFEDELDQMEQDLETMTNPFES